MAKVYTADARQQTDGAFCDLLQKVNSKYPIVLISRPGGYVFNEEIKSLDKYILVNGEELGWDGRHDITHFFGKNSHEFGDGYNTDEWRKLDDFVSSKPPLITFTRELLKADENETNKPIEYPALYSVPLQSKQEFDNRPLEVFFNWGLSNPSRPKLHGDIFSKCDKYGYIVYDNLAALDGFLQHESNPRKWLTVHTAWYARYPMGNVIAINGLAKISVSLFGAGRKCFRSSEAPVNSIMALPYDNLAWSFDWVSSVNCFRLQEPISNYVGWLNVLLKCGDIYDIYCNGVETSNKYFLPNYLQHLENIINNA